MALPDRPLTRVETFLDAIANGDASGLPSPLTREEQFLEAVANNDASGLPSPLTREEQYLGAIASGDASGIPSVPFTREEQYFEAIATGSDSYPSTPLTRTEQYLEYIAENGGGGGGGTLETSGWVKSLDGGATVSGNTVDLPSGSSSHKMTLSPPNAQFEKGDVVVIAFTVTDNSARLNVLTNNKSNGTLTSKDGYLVNNEPESEFCTYGHCDGLGSDVATFNFSQNFSYNINFSPVSSSGASSRNAHAIIEITGIRYNGETIFGKV